MARFRLRLPPPQPSPASQGREQLPGDVLDYEEGWTTKRVGQRVGWTKSWLDNKRLIHIGVRHVLLVRQEKLAESSGWKSRRGRS